MVKGIYVTEPDVIDVDYVTSLLPDCQIIRGDVSFSGESLSDVEAIIIRSETVVSSSIKDFFPNLGHVIRIGVGVDKVDMDFCSQHGIKVYNAPGANADAVSDYVVAVMFMALRKMHTLTTDDIKSWNRFKFIGHSMSSRSIGIIGFGNIGRQIFTKLQGFGCKDFFVYDPYVKASDMPAGVTVVDSVNEVLDKSNVVTVHVPLLPSTKDLINTANLSLLERDSILINASRGGIVNEVDVAECADRGELVYVADAVENEPNISSSLLEGDNIIVTPHVASLTSETETDVLRVAIDNFLSGQAIN